MSLTKLVLSTLLDLFLAIVVAFAFVVGQAALTSPSAAWGTLRALHAIGLPLDKLGLQARVDREITWRFEVRAHCLATPADDAALLEWLRKQPDIERVSVERRKLRAPQDQGETERVGVQYFGAEGSRRLDVPWEELGYRLGKPQPNVWWYRMSPDECYTPADKQVALIVVASLMIGGFVVGIVRMWRNRKLDSVAPVSDASGLLSGILLGGVLAALYWLYQQAVLHWGGPVPALAPSWSSLPISAVDMRRPGIPVSLRAVEPHPFLLGMVGAGTFLFPVAMMVFVWGVFRRWTHAGWVKTGCVLAAAATAGLFLSWSHFPIWFVIILVLTWLGQRTQSLGPPLVALILVLAAVVGTVFGAIPSLSHPVTQLPGPWRPVVGPGRVVFSHGGGAASSDLVEDSAQPLLIMRSAWHYDWIANDTIRLTWARHSQNNARTTFTSDWVHEDYKVNVDWEELTLTRVSDGVAQKFRRVD